MGGGLSRVQPTQDTRIVPRFHMEETLRAEHRQPPPPDPPAEPPAPPAEPPAEPQKLTWSEQLSRKTAAEREHQERVQQTIKDKAFSNLARMVEEQLARLADAAQLEMLGVVSVIANSCRTHYDIRSFECSECHCFNWFNNIHADATRAALAIAKRRLEARDPGLVWTLGNVGVNVTYAVAFASTDAALRRKTDALVSAAANMLALVQTATSTLVSRTASLSCPDSDALARCTGAVAGAVPHDAAVQLLAETLAVRDRLAAQGEEVRLAVHALEAACDTMSLHLCAGADKYAAIAEGLIKPPQNAHELPEQPASEGSL